MVIADMHRLHIVHITFLLVAPFATELGEMLEWPGRSELAILCLELKYGDDGEQLLDGILSEDVG